MVGKFAALVKHAAASECAPNSERYSLYVLMFTPCVQIVKYLYGTQLASGCSEQMNAPGTVAAGGWRRVHDGSPMAAD
jgi:hypothetical protein